MNLGKEFLFCVLYLIISFLIIIGFSMILYWFLQVKITNGWWILLVLTLPILYYFATQKIMSKINIRKEGKEFAQFAGLFAVATLLIPSNEIYKEILEEFRSIETVQEVRPNIIEKYELKNVKIINYPFSYSNIRKVTKPGRLIFEVFYLFPFDQNTQNVFYALKFDQYEEPNIKDSTKRRILEELILKTKDSLTSYHFNKVKNFERVTKIDFDYEGYKNAYAKAYKFTKKSDFIILRPYDVVERKMLADDSKKYLLGIFIAYIVLFWLTRLNEL